MSDREIDPRRIALIGFGEFGKTFARGFLATGRHEVASYDILFDNSERGATLRETARAMGVEAAPTAAAAASGAQVVISAVTASSAFAVAEAAARYLRPGQFFLDINSVSPDDQARRCGGGRIIGRTLRRGRGDGPGRALWAQSADAARRHGGGGIWPRCSRPPGCAWSRSRRAIGEASAIKMCRSVMIKGIEALAVECFMTARRYGVEDRIVASLNETFKPLDWEKLAGYLIERVVQHGRRRAAEMREAAETVAAIGLDPVMTSATAIRQDWVADRVDALPALKTHDGGGVARCRGPASRAASARKRTRQSRPTARRYSAKISLRRATSWAWRAASATLTAWPTPR